MFFVPAFVLYAQNIPVGPTQGTVTFQSGIVTGCQQSGKEVPCDSFFQLIQAVKNVINTVVALALAFSVVIIAWAGWQYMTSGGEPAKRTKANAMFEKVAWGIGWVLAAWLIVNLIVTALVDPSKVTNLMK